MREKLKRITNWIPAGLAIVYASITPFIFTHQAAGAISGIAALIAGFCYAISREI